MNRADIAYALACYDRFARLYRLATLGRPLAPGIVRDLRLRASILHEAGTALERFRDIAGLGACSAL